MTASATTQNKKNKPIWTRLVTSYQTPIRRASNWQILNTFVPFLVLWYLMYRSLEISYIFTLLLAVPTAGFVVRMFIIQHDCGHGSFYQSRKWNNRAGSVCGIFTLVPYYHWRKMHAIHHANAGKLGDARGVGDFHTMTVDEYFAASKWHQLYYRIYRHTFFLIGIVPSLVFVFGYRFPFRMTKERGWKRERNSVYWTNLGIILVTALLVWQVGLKSFLLVQIPITYLATSIGAWFFFVQHQFEDAYWAREDEWSYEDAALKGSSFYKLPPILQWFSGNIGFHHIHHLSPKIPNYRLQSCHQENPMFQEVQVMTIRTSFKTLSLGLWSEQEQRLISFREARQSRKTGNLNLEKGEPVSTGSPS
jgi:omega-6 fatty acid desaturase (delta-12 desaturase)